MILLAMSFSALAQGIQLSSEQQQMLNQLPPAQRQQAMQAIRQLEAQQATTTQQTIREQPTSASSPVTPSAIDAVLQSDQLVAKGRSRLIIDFRSTSGVGDAAMRRLEGSRLYTLDEDGVLLLQGYSPISLLGLAEEDIERRLRAEPYLDQFAIDVRILGQETVGVDSLKPFGYDVFEPRGATFEAPSTGPVPADYVLGPGDTVRVQLFGNVNGIYEYEVSRDGVLNLPELGPVTVAGIPFSEFRSDLDKRVKEMLIGTQVSVTMGQLRTIRVFVLGDVNRPGSYVVGGLATISAALYQSGGISGVGSLRSVELKRNGRRVAKLDLYDLLLRGDTSSDRRLQAGDVIFVPPRGSTISIAGAVKRPAIYETTGEASVADAVRLAGGLAPDAYGAGAQLERIEGGRKTIAVDLTSAQADRVRVRAGDKLSVPEVLPSLEGTVVLAGHVYRPGSYQWRSGMKLTDLIGSVDLLKPGADTGYVLIRREIDKGQSIDVLSTNLQQAFDNPSSSANIALRSSDTVNVFSRELGRQRVVEPLLEELRLQASVEKPAQKVQVAGLVRAPGIYPLEANMRVSDLIRAGGNLSEAAYVLEAELTRYAVSRGEGREIEIEKVDLDAILRGDSSADLVLRPHDYLIINQIPEWNTTWTVSLEGEVKFPGLYRVRRGETLAEVLERAGGMTEAAYPEGVVFLRESLREQEQEQIDALSQRLEADLATLSLQRADANGGETLATGRELLGQLRKTPATGRLVIDLTNSSASVAVLEMRDGDRLLIPTRPQVVTVLGETQQNTSHLYQDNLSRDDYIGLSGGLTRRADRKLIYVVRANGAVVAGNRSKWFGRRGQSEILPGDTIVVPLDTDRMRPLTFWGSVTQILYQGAIAVAAVRTFDN
jgi:protein involved in polysaccharide export with SLBB domain